MEAPDLSAYSYEYMYAALPFPTRPPRIRQSNPPVDKHASRPRSRRSILPISRSSISGQAGKTRPDEETTGGSKTLTKSPDIESDNKVDAGAGSAGGAGGDSAGPRNSTSTTDSGHTRATPASVTSPDSGSSTSTPRASKKPSVKINAAPHIHGISTRDLRKVAMYPDAEASKHAGNHPKQANTGSSFTRTESVSSTSVTTALSTRTVTSTDPSASGETASNSPPKPFAQRNGRTYLSDATLPYPLPVDLAELHRQSLRTLLLIQVHGTPVACPALTAKPPQRVLEIGCGPGFWSMMCHRYFKSRGHSGISFTGIDIAPVSPGSANTPSDSIKPDPDMKWNFVQHDLRNCPWPFADGEFDLVLNKDMTMAISLSNHMAFTDECLRVLKQGGIIEIWETDHTIRMLRPHVPGASVSGSQAEEHEAASSLGAYLININTPLSAPLNTFLVEYNNWISRALEARELMPNPTTVVNHYLLQEGDLTGAGSHRVAIPLSEVRWEREGVGGVVTKDGKSYVEMKGERPPHQKVEKKTLTAGQAALRKTALLTLVEEIQALEPVLREASGKSSDEWDVWFGKMMADLMNESGTSWGECLETGAWWAKKK